MMRVILRCMLAITAALACAKLVTKSQIVHAQSCPCTGYCQSPVPACPHPSCDQGSGCTFYWVCDSPIIVDVKREGFHLTDKTNGVLFKFSGNNKQQVAWTDAKYNNAWLALDRNSNGMIDDASELFGNFSPQPSSRSPNGFSALAVYDLPENGGNGDGQITPADTVYSRLVLWTDRNHNGISEPEELQSLAQGGITSISLTYHNSHWQDQYGNLFRYRGHITEGGAAYYDHLIYDVYLNGAN